MILAGELTSTSSCIFYVVVLHVFGYMHYSKITLKFCRLTSMQISPHVYTIRFQNPKIKNFHASLLVTQNHKVLNQSSHSNVNTKWAGLKNSRSEKALTLMLFHHSRPNDLVIWWCTTLKWKGKVTKRSPNAKIKSSLFFHSKLMSKTLC